MTQQFKQVIYCNDNSEKNFPSELTGTQLITGSAFSPYMPLLQLGIQAPPGTKIYFNGEQTYPVIIGFTGIFELDLRDGGSITQMCFDTNSISNIQSNDSAIIIVDMAYLGG